MPVPGAEVGGLQRQVEALLAVLQGLLLGALACDVADHADHASAAVARGLLQAAADLQPVQRAIGPANAMAHGTLGFATVEHFAEQPQYFDAVFLGDQLNVFHRLPQWAVGVQAEQRLGATGPVDLAGIDVPGPGTQTGAVQRGQKARGILPGLLEGDGVEGRNMGKRKIRVTGFAHARPFPSRGQISGPVNGGRFLLPSGPFLM
ncbi:hypothetical protein D9M70_387470 [compost metagenome]